jgi:HEAT repeat protein
MVLGDSVPAVRRAAALGLGRAASPQDREALWKALAGERTVTVATALAVAAVRCGTPAAVAHAALVARVGRPLQTARGQREVDGALGLGARMAERELVLALCPEHAGTSQVDWSAVTLRPADDVRAGQLAALDREADSAAGRQAVEALAAHGRPEDLARVLALRQEAGRRTDHACVNALGRLGDPRALSALMDALVEMDVDPGRAFAHRRLGAIALGRLGLPGTAPKLHQAMTREAREHEGRPGAGLGIQFPVRSNLLWAVGEVQSPKSATVLAPYLGNLSGSALGGFHLTAMGALVKLGEPAVAPTVAVVHDGSDDAAANALGVLAGLACDVPAARRALAALAGRPDARGRQAAALLRD